MADARPGPPRRVTDGNGAQPRTSGCPCPPSGGSGDTSQRATGSRRSASSARRTRTSTTSSSARSWPTFFALVAVRLRAGEHAVRLGSTWPSRGSIANARPGSFEDAFYFSVQTIATIGYGGMYPAHPLRAHPGRHRGDDRHPVASRVITGLTFTRFSRPSARVLFSDKVTHHAARRRPAPDVPDGQLAPQPDRRGAPAAWSCWSTSGRARGRCCGGRSICRWCAIKTAIFFLTWTAMHLIDETSPFYGPGCARAPARAAARSCS